MPFATPLDSPLEGYLGFVVITLNEADQIAANLTAVVSATQTIARTQVVVVDSGSTDDTVAQAVKFPVTLLQYSADVRSAAAGRQVGCSVLATEFILCLDGDCVINPDWLPVALQLMHDNPTAGVVYSRGVEVRQGQQLVESTESLGGNALYRAAALAKCGGFHPYLRAEEEGELLGRLLLAGYQPLVAPVPMYHHYTENRIALEGVTERFRRGMLSARGQVLRLAVKQNTLGFHIRRFRAYVATAGLLLVFVASLVLGLATQNWYPTLVVAALATTLTGLLWRKRRVHGDIAQILSDWLVHALGLLVGLWQPLARRESFHPRVRLIQSP